MYASVVWATILSATAPTAPGDASEPCSIAVLNLQPQGLASDQQHVPQILTDSIATELSGYLKCRIVTQADISSMLDFEAAKAACSDNAESCLAEIGAALGVQRVVAGSVGRLGDSYFVQLRLIDNKAAVVSKRVELLASDDANELRTVARQGARQLFDLSGGGDAAAASPAPAGPFSSPWLYVGSGVALVGLAALGVGSFFAFDANERLGDPARTDKDDARTLGFVTIAVASGGAVVTALGLGLLPLAFVE